jgi:hypothetical protein
MLYDCSYWLLLFQQTLKLIELIVPNITAGNNMCIFAFPFCLVVYNQILYYVKLSRILYFGSQVSIKKFESFIFQDYRQFFIVVYEIAVRCVETAWTGMQFRLHFSANISCIRLVLLFSFYLCFWYYLLFFEDKCNIRVVWGYFYCSNSILTQLLTT